MNDSTDVQLSNARSYELVGELGEMIVESASESIVVYDEFGRIVFWNKASQLLYGWRSSEMVGRRIEEFTVDLSDKSDWGKLLAQGHWQGNLLRLSLDGDHVHVKSRMMVKRTSDGTASVIEYGSLAGEMEAINAASRDSEQPRIEQQLRQIEADFAHAARVSALGELVTSIAHEVRQPLSVIVTDADTGLRWLGRTDPNLAKVQQLVARIKESALRANRVIQRIKDMAVRSDPVRQAIDINEIVKEAVLFVKAETEAHSISLRLQLAEELPNIAGDRVQLQQVAVNLLINSIQAITQSAAGHREIVIDTSHTGGTVSLTIRDTGGGIPAADLERVFDGFFSTKPDGMGMGLAICRSIITDHGGIIRAANCGSHGAAFRVLLPVNASTEA